MFDHEHDTVDAAGEAMRRGLSAIPCPAPSSDFDERVLARLAPTRGLGDILRELILAARPAVVSAAVTIPIALFAINVTAISLSVPLTGGGPIRDEWRPVAEEKALERQDLTPASLRRLWAEDLTHRSAPAVHVRRGRSA